MRWGKKISLLKNLQLQIRTFILLKAIFFLLSYGEMFRLYRHRKDSKQIREK